MFNFSKWFSDKPVNVNDLSDKELVEVVAFYMNKPEYHVYTMACNEIGISDQEVIDKSFEKFYFACLRDRPCLLPINIRKEFRKAYEILTK